MHRQDVYSTQGDSNLKTDRRKAIGLVGHPWLSRDSAVLRRDRCLMCLPAARQISIGLRTQCDPSGGVGVSLSHPALRLLENWSHTKTVVPDEAKRVARGADATRRLVAVIVLALLP
jgi:hypothetical protein